MTPAEVSPELQVHIARQLGYLRRSARLFDEGDRDEAIRIAVTIRVLLHDTGVSTSLLSLAGSKSIRILTSCSFTTTEAFLALNMAMEQSPSGWRDHCSLVIAKSDEHEAFSI